MDDIIKLFQQAKENGNKEISISYLLLNSSKTQNEIYEDIHNLLDNETIKKIEYSQCPKCMCLNKDHYSQMVKCNRCKEYYIPNCIIEKFALVHSNFL